MYSQRSNPVYQRNLDENRVDLLGLAAIWAPSSGSPWTRRPAGRARNPFPYWKTSRTLVEWSGPLGIEVKVILFWDTWDPLLAENFVSLAMLINTALPFGFMSSSKDSGPLGSKLWTVMKYRLSNVTPEHWNPAAGVQLLTRWEGIYSYPAHNPKRAAVFIPYKLLLIRRSIFLGYHTSLGSRATGLAIDMYSQKG